MRILVLGGTGAMGVPVIQMLADRGEDVYITSRRIMKSQNEKVHYIRGNAHNMEFLKELLKLDYDAVIDFMVYTMEEFQERYELILKRTKQYVFLSSSRVYAVSDKPITEDSARLLDAMEDEVYLKTKEYALEKARQENCLKTSTYENWTIIRPYITYNNERLQLGVFEKEYWLYRALQGRSIVFSRDIANKLTTLTHGNDVARKMAGIIGVKEALGEIYQVTTNQVIRWEQVLSAYLDTIEKVTGKRSKVYLEETADGVARVLNNYYQIRYDRWYNRVFDSKKINQAVQPLVPYTETIEGLSQCLEEFLQGNRRFLCATWKLEAYFDKLTGEHTPLREITGWKQKVKYLVFRYTPYFKFIEILKR